MGESRLTIPRGIICGHLVIIIVGEHKIHNPRFLKIAIKFYKISQIFKTFFFYFTLKKSHDNKYS